VDFTTANGAAAAGVDYVAQMGTLTFSPGETSKAISVTINGDTLNEDETLESYFVNLSNPTEVIITDAQGRGLIVDYERPIFNFGSSDFTVSENSNVSITIHRGGSALGSVSVSYFTTDVSAQQRTDYTTASGVLTFAPGEGSKTIPVLITDDGYVEGLEQLTLTLSSPSGGDLGGITTTTVNIQDNDSSPSATNPIDSASFFVRQHYSDFLAREPDPGGLAFWTNEIEGVCEPADAACINRRRKEVSDAFFFETEFQQTGGFVFRLYRAAYGNTQPFPNPDPAQPNESLKLPAYAVFSIDRAKVIVGPTLSQSQLTLATNFTTRPEFLARYPASLDGPAFVDAILAQILTDSQADLRSERTTLINLFNSGGRGAVLYRLVDDSLTNPINNNVFIDAEYRRTFVYTEYAGYLRRDSDIAGFLFWLNQVNQFPVRDVSIQHTMACAFITSTEYQQRFSSVVTRSNQDCAQ
jgi:hypothetical protein